MSATTTLLEVAPPDKTWTVAAAPGRPDGTFATILVGLMEIDVAGKPAIERSAPVPKPEP
jgi:hypothetical protein